MISVQNVSKVFGHTAAVKNISFDVRKGEHCVLLGTSGCGKTTTLRLINRLIDTTQGTIQVNDQDIKAQAPEKLRRNIGYVLQRNSLFPHYTVFENIAVVPKLLGWDKQLIAERILQLTQKVHLKEEQLQVYPQQLSGGEAQRVNLARALVANPSVLLMDEPFSALDNITRSSIRREFMELDELKQKTILMVTHDVQEAFEMGDVICLMDKGRIMQTAKPAELLFNPANDFVRDFFSDSFLQLAFSVTRLRDIWRYLNNEISGDGRAINISSACTISKAMEHITDKNSKELFLTIQDDTTNETKTTGWQGVLTAFSQYRINN